MIDEPQQDVCTWVYYTQEGDDDQYLQSACGDVVFFDAGNPVENGYRFCPFCGRKLVFNHESD